MDKEKKTVLRALSMISQLGISVMVPIALCVFVGLKIDKHFNTYWVIPFLFLGIMAGGRNAYRLAMSFVDSNDRNPDKSDDKDKDVSDESKD